MRINSNKLDRSCSSTLPFKPQVFFHQLPTIPPTEKNKNTARASKHVVKTKSIRKRDNVYFVPINQHFALIRVYVSFIKTLVSSKKNSHLVLMINILLSNHIFCLESLVPSNNVFRKRTYNYIPFIAIFVLYTLITTYIVIKNFEPPVYKSQAT